jgi:hypothetical protein
MQRWLITGAIVFGLLALCAVIYTYERHYRGLREAALVGTWVRDPFSGLYYEWRRDGTIVVIDSDGTPTHIKGKWYAGGSNIYVRFPPDILDGRQLVIWHIVEISPDEIQVRTSHGGETMIWRRVKPSAASNHTMQPTADPRTASFSHD